MKKKYRYFVSASYIKNDKAGFFNAGVESDKKIENTDDIKELSSNLSKQLEKNEGGVVILFYREF